TVGHVGTVPQAVVYGAEIPQGGVLVAEYLDHLLAVQHFFNKTVHHAQVVLLADVVFARQTGETGGHQHHDTGCEHRDHGQGWVEHQHGHEGGRHGHGGVDDLGNALAQQLAQGVN